MAKNTLSVFFYKIPAPFRNPFLIAATLFVIWLVFFDRNNLISQRHLQNTIDNMEAKKVYYEEQIEQVSEQNNNLFTNQDALEKFARENYLMKKDNEDIFVIVEEDK